MKQIDVLPDDVLLIIFDFYAITDPSSEGIPSRASKKAIEAWQQLVHVCRRWRSLVLESPRRLNLRLYCTYETRIRDTLDIWPALPLVVEGPIQVMGLPPDTDNIIAALGQSNRVCKVNLTLADSQLEQVLPAMQVPFPELTQMLLSSDDDSEAPPALPDSFLGGSAPRLRKFSLCGIPFPRMPFLLSATHLVQLYLSDLPESEYISPDGMVALLAVSSNLETFDLDFRSPESCLDSSSRSPMKRSILPALTSFFYQGVSEYIEGIVTRIDTPQLNVLDVYLFNQIGTPRLAQFINRTSLRECDKAHVKCNNWSTSVELLAQVKDSGLCITILGKESDRHLSSVALFYNPLHPLSTVEDLYIADDIDGYPLVDAIENTLWLQLLRPFTVVKNLYLSKVFAPSVVAALQEPAGGRIVEVLPSLQNLFVEGFGPSQENIGQFVAARQLSGHPIAVRYWEGERE